MNNKSQTSANQSHSYPAGEPWPEPVSLERPVLPVFPVEQVPEPLRGWVSATAEATQTPVDMAALMALAICGASAARRVVIEAGRGWLEPIILYVAICLGPGNRKTAVVDSALKPLATIERELVVDAQPAIAVAKAALDMLEASRKDAMRRAGKNEEGAANEVSRLAVEIAKAKVPIEPLLITDNATPESVEIALRDQGGRLICAGSEGGIFDIMNGQYSGKPNFDVFLKGHANEDHRSLRVNRPGFIIPKCCLTVAYAVQPEVVRGLASNQSMRGRGLLGRFMYSLPISPLGNRKVDPDPVSPAIEKAYETLIRRLFSIQDDRGKPWKLKLDQDAESRFREWRIQLELMFREDGSLELMKDWGGKLAGLAARIAAICHLVENQSTTPWNDFVSLKTINAGITIAEWAIPHAEAVLGLMVADDGAIDDAIYIHRKLANGSEPVISRRDIQNHGRRRFDSDSERLDRAIKILVDRGWIRPVDLPKAVGRPTTKYEVYPGLVRPISPGQKQAADQGGNDTTPTSSSDDRETGVI